MVLRLIHIAAFISGPFLLLLSGVPSYEYTRVYLSLLLLLGIITLFFVLFFKLLYSKIILFFSFDIQVYEF